MTGSGLPWYVCLVVGALGATAVVALYTIRWRLPQRVVATTALWLEAVARGRRRRLGVIEQPLSLAIQLSVVAALALALAQPRAGCQSAGGRSVVIVLDRSSSMGAKERVETRLDMARRRASLRLLAMAADDSVGVVLGGGEPQVAAPLLRDPTPARRALAAAALRAGPGRLGDAVALGCRMLGAARPASLVVVSDGGEGFGACPGVDVEVAQVGSPRENVGITALSTAFLPRDPREASAYVEVSNGGGRKASVELRLDLDGSLVQVTEIALEPGKSDHRVFEHLVPRGPGRLTARLARVTVDGGGKDALADDDVAFAVLERPPQVAIDLVGESAPLKLALSANPRYTVTPRRVPPAASVLTVIAGEISAPLGPGRYLLVDPRGRYAPLERRGEVRSPAITWWRDDHPVLRQVVLSDVLISKAPIVSLPVDAVPLAGSPETPLVFTYNDGARRMVGLGFDPADSNLPLRVGFPVLLYNAIDWLLEAGGDAEAASMTLAATEAVRVTPPGEPARDIEPLDGRAAIERGPAGFYEVTTTRGEPLRTFAVSVASRTETALAQRPAAASAASGRARDREPASYLIGLALMLLLVEWVTYHRRVTT